MLKKKLEKALNDQMNREFYSSYLYLAMAVYFEEANLTGAASWMRFQVQEELIHAQKMLEYILSRRNSVQLNAIAKPTSTWKNPAAVFAASLKHEESISSHIHKLAKLARDESDPATFNFLQWFIQEQVEEEATVHTICEKIKMIGDSTTGLFMFDQELGKRQPPVPA